MGGIGSIVGYCALNGSHTTVQLAKEGWVAFDMGSVCAVCLRAFARKQENVSSLGYLENQPAPRWWTVYEVGRQREGWGNASWPLLVSGFFFRK